MKITPIEIKQKSFTSRSFGKGYDKEEVAAFLSLLAREWENLQDENKEQKIKLSLLEKEIDKLKEVETSLFRTLKTAEDSSANIIDQARRTAELKVREAQIKADVLLNDAREQAKMIVQKANERARNTIEDLVHQMQGKEREYTELENIRDNFISEIKSYIHESLEKIERFDGRHTKSNTYFEEKIKEAQSFLEEKNQFIDRQNYLDEQEKNQLESEEEESLEENSQTDMMADDDSDSFFDNLNS